MTGIVWPVPGSPASPCLPPEVKRIDVLRADDSGREVSEQFTDVGLAVQAVARHMARSGVYEIRICYVAG